MTDKNSLISIEENPKEHRDGIVWNLFLFIESNIQSLIAGIDKRLTEISIVKTKNSSNQDSSKPYKE